MVSKRVSPPSSVFVNHHNQESFSYQRHSLILTWDTRLYELSIILRKHRDILMFCERDTKFLDLSSVVMVESTVEISQNFVAFSKYMNFNKKSISNRVSTHSVFVNHQNQESFSHQRHFLILACDTYPLCRQKRA